VGAESLAAPALVLGAAGFLGSHLVDALVHQGSTVRVFDRSRHWAHFNELPGVEIFEGDFGNRADITAALDGCDTVFHLVGTTLPKASNDDPVHDLESNLLTTVQFLEVARRSRVKKIVFASSGGTVYGVPTTLPIPEHHATRPLCSYGIHKLAIEQYLHLHHTLYGLDYCVLRLANPFGERQRPDASQGAVSVFLDKALRGEEIVVWGDGSAVRDYVYVGDVAQAFCQAARYTGTPRIFNVGAGQGVSVNELISVIEAAVGQQVQRQYLPSRPFDVPVNVLDISLAAAHLGWQPRCSFREGLRRTLEWQLTLRTNDRGATWPVGS
jgi:UDP-glucose 4-epimerase